MVCLLTRLKMSSYGDSLVMAKSKQIPHKYYLNISCILLRGLLRWII